MPTVEAIIGIKLRRDFWIVIWRKRVSKAQQTDEPKNPNQPDNLFSPVARDFGAHGTFDSRAKKFSFELWLEENRGMAFAMFSLSRFLPRSSLHLLQFPKSFMKTQTEKNSPPRRPQTLGHSPKVYSADAVTGRSRRC